MGIKVGANVPNILWDLLDSYLCLDLFSFRIYNQKAFCEFQQRLLCKVPGQKLCSAVDNYLIGWKIKQLIAGIIFQLIEQIGEGVTYEQLNGDFYIAHYVILIFLVNNLTLQKLERIVDYI